MYFDFDNNSFTKFNSNVEILFYFFILIFCVDGRSVALAAQASSRPTPLPYTLTPPHVLEGQDSYLSILLRLTKLICNLL